MYKQRLGEILQSHTDARVKRVQKLFDKYDTDENGYLDIKECRLFFAHVFQLKYRKKKHQKMFIKILTKVGTFDQKHRLVVTKEKMAGYFSCPSLFVDLEDL